MGANEKVRIGAQGPVWQERRFDGDQGWEGTGRAVPPFPFVEQLLALATMLMRSVSASNPLDHPIAVGAAVFSTLQVRKPRFRTVKSLFPDHTATLRCRQDSKSMFQAGQS